MSNTPHSNPALEYVFTVIFAVAFLLLGVWCIYNGFKGFEDGVDYSDMVSFVCGILIVMPRSYGK